jgi:crotonobetainyl-CoA:carnitine CoA-transferase CaiB-like acyl-CoA transferase
VSLPLDGVLVVACEQAVAAPLATRSLADLGARVIKIERPGPGDFARGYDEAVLGLSSHFVWLNRSKESVTLDLKRPEAAGILDRLLGRADVFVQNLAPAAAERLGLQAEALCARFPRLIACSISGFGDGGPYRDAKAYDLLIQSETGLISVTGTEEAPAKSGIPAADIGAGMYAMNGILAALYERERTGRGAPVEVSLFDSLTEWMGFPLYYARYGGSPPRRSGLEHPAIAPYGPFTAGDGIETVIAIQNDREWRSFATTVLRQPALGTDARFRTNSARVRNRAELHARINEVLAALGTPVLAGRLDAAGIAYGQRREPADLWDHPQHVARYRRTTVGSPAGDLDAILPPVTLPGRRPRMDPIPAVGEHTRAVLEWLGCSAAQIAALAADGVT